MIVCTFQYKKLLKEAVGTDIRPHLMETSISGPEYRPDLGGLAVVGPGPYNRKWYAQIWVKDNILVKVR